MVQGIGKGHLLAEIILKVGVVSPPKWLNVHVFQTAEANSTVKLGKIR